MIEVEIPKDISEFEPKLIGPFTKRTLLCVIAIVATSILGYTIFNKIFDNGLRIILPLFFDIPWALIAAYKPYGMKFEKYFMSQLYTTIIPPKHRKYKIENIHEEFEKKLIAEENAQAVKAAKASASTTKKQKKGGQK